MGGSALSPAATATRPQSRVANRGACGWGQGAVVCHAAPLHRPAGAVTSPRSACLPHGQVTWADHLARHLVRSLRQDQLAGTGDAQGINLPIQRDPRLHPALGQGPRIMQRRASVAGRAAVLAGSAPQAGRARRVQDRAAARDRGACSSCGLHPVKQGFQPGTRAGGHPTRQGKLEQIGQVGITQARGAA